MFRGIRWYEMEFQNFSNEEIIKHIDIIEKLIDSDLVADSIFIDDVLEAYEILKQECVRRVCVGAV